MYRKSIEKTFPQFNVCVTINRQNENEWRCSQVDAHIFIHSFTIREKIFDNSKFYIYSPDLIIKKVDCFYCTGKKIWAVKLGRQQILKHNLDIRLPNPDPS